MGMPLLSPEEGLVLPVVAEDPPLSSKPPSGQVKSLPPPGMEGLSVAGDSLGLQAHPIFAAADNDGVNGLFSIIIFTTTWMVLSPTASEISPEAVPLATSTPLTKTLPSPVRGGR